MYLHHPRKEIKFLKFQKMGRWLLVSGFWQEAGNQLQEASCQKPVAKNAERGTLNPARLSSSQAEPLNLSLCLGGEIVFPQNE